MIAFKASISGFGAEAFAMEEENMYIFFGDKVSETVPMLADYCILLRDHQLSCEISAGDTVYFNTVPYRITAVGEVCSQNLSQLGHCVAVFDGADVPLLPGHLHLEKKDPPSFCKEMSIEIVKHDLETLSEK